jgi:NADPH:quinone reductase-like Zn-dependent oxidoreductase
MISLAPSFLRKKPTVPELDFSGTVVSVGPSVASTRPDLSLGNSVFGSIHIASMMKTGYGTLAEYVAIEAERVVKVPEGMGMEEAAGLGVAGCTALELVDKAKLEEGTRVLVNGASGGIGVLVVQMVRERIGKTGVIVAVCSGANGEMVRGLGADEVGVSGSFLRLVLLLYFESYCFTPSVTALFPMLFLSSVNSLLRVLLFYFLRTPSILFHYPK